MLSMLGADRWPKVVGWLPVLMVAAGCVVLVAGLVQAVAKLNPDVVPSPPQLANALLGGGLVVFGLDMKRPSLGLDGYALAMIVGALGWSAWHRRRRVPPS
jgi:predicted benzoate:H+ symporter BenE